MAPNHETDVGEKRSAVQVQASNIGSVFQSSVLVDKLTGHNPTEDISFVKVMDEIVEIATTYNSQKNQKHFEKFNLGQLLEKTTF